MKKTIGLITILAVMLLSLTGCAQVNYEIEVNEDGSGEITYVYGISKANLGSAADLVEQFVDSMKEQATEGGYNVETYEDAEISGFKANKHIQDLSKDFSLEEAFGEEYVKDTEDSKFKIEKSFWSTKYSQNAELDLTNLTDENVKMTYKIKLPAKATTNNANTVSNNGRELTWTLKSGELNKIEFTAEELNMLPIMIIAVVIIAVIAVIIVIAVRGKSNKENVTKSEQ